MAENGRIDGLTALGLEVSKIAFTIPGRIGGKGRPKFSTRGGFARAYTPAKTRSTEALVRTLADEAMRGRPLLEGPVEVEISICQTPPPSWSKRRQAEARWITGKPDADNVAKLIGDALNGVVWKDDSQISKLSFDRQYRRTEGERVEITIRELNAASPTITYSSDEGRAG